MCYICVFGKSLSHFDVFYILFVGNHLGSSVHVEKKTLNLSSSNESMDFFLRGAQWPCKGTLKNVSFEVDITRSVLALSLILGMNQNNFSTTFLKIRSLGEN